MTLANMLRSEAGMIAENIETQGVGIAADLQKAEQVVAELKAKLDNRQGIQNRLSDYKPEEGRDPDCPYCWLFNAKHSPVTPIQVPGEADHYTCKECGFECEDPAP